MFRLVLYTKMQIFPFSPIFIFRTNLGNCFPLENKRKIAKRGEERFVKDSPDSDIQHLKL